MNIKPLLTQNKPSAIPLSKTDSLKLKLNQQLEVKIISSKSKTQTLAVEITSSKKTLHLQSNQSFESKPGQTLDLVVTKLSPVAEFKILNAALNNPLNKEAIILKQSIPADQIKKAVEHVKSVTTPIIISAKIVAISKDAIQLKLYTSPAIQNDESSKQKQNILQQKNPIITLTKEQLIPADSKVSKFALQQNLIQINNYKSGQKIQLEVKTSGLNSEFKIADNAKLNPIKGHIVSATVIGLKNNQIRLQIPLNNSSSAFTLDRQQLIKSMASGPKSRPFALDNIKLGEQIQLEAFKTKGQIEFRLLSQTANSEQRILESVKQLFPIQQQPSELIGQLTDKFTLINNNENIPDALKRLAKEILNGIPQLKEIDHKQLKKLITQSGLFLEAKLAQSAVNRETDLSQPDFKNLLLKFQQMLKQEVEHSKETKMQSAEINLLKEMQQKTENSLAKIILNQFASLPKEDSARQVWVLDLPFVEQEKAETVRVEIDRKQQADAPEEHENWTVSVTITPQEKETIYCKITCYDQTINTLFWSDNEEVVEEIDQHLDYLKTQLEKSGLNTGHMSANIGVPKTEIHQKIKGQTLFDQKV